MIVSFRLLGPLDRVPMGNGRTGWLPASVHRKAEGFLWKAALAGGGKRLRVQFRRAGWERAAAVEK